MTPRSPIRALTLAAIGLSAALIAGAALRTTGVLTLPPIHAAAPDAEQAARAIHSTQTGTPVSTTRASGTFTVKLTPQELHKKIEGAPVGRLSIDKQFQGDLEGTSIGEMLSAGTEVKGSAGYVAIERITGTLHGKHGTFVLQHNGILTRGVPQLSCTVVPDSGTGELIGLSGSLAINIVEGKHLYEFNYTLAAPSASAKPQ
jgi:hypothetical protein